MVINTVIQQRMAIVTLLNENSWHTYRESSIVVDANHALALHHLVSVWIFSSGAELLLLLLGRSSHHVLLIGKRRVPYVGVIMQARSVLLLAKDLMLKDRWLLNDMLLLLGLS